MKILFVDEYLTPLSSLESDVVPRAGDRVSINDMYYVDNVLWQPIEKSVYVILTDREPKSETKQELSVDKSVIRESKEAQQKANEALKETKDLKRQVFNLTQRFKTLPKTK